VLSIIEYINSGDFNDEALEACLGLNAGVKYE